MWHDDEYEFEFNEFESNELPQEGLDAPDCPREYQCCHELRGVSDEHAEQRAADG